MNTSKEESTMAKRLKWNAPGIEFKRSNHDTLIATFDNSSDKWFIYDGQTKGADVFKHHIYNLAVMFGAKTITVKKMWTDGQLFEPTEPKENRIHFSWLGFGRPWIYKKDGVRFIDISPEEIFT